ncbi:unnamed protein product, partial [Ectocarpus fasciculatus]
SAAPPHRPLHRKTLRLRSRARRWCSSALLLLAVVLSGRPVQRPSPPPQPPLAAVASSAEPLLCPASWAGGRALAWTAPPSSSRYKSPCCLCVPLLLPTAPQPRWGEFSPN